MSFQEEALSKTLAGVSDSLIPLIFRNRDKRGKPSPNNFETDYLPRTAVIVCKFTGLLLQAYWLLLKSKSRTQDVSAEYHIPSQLDDILLQLWAGHQKYIDGFAISIIHQASIAPETTIIGQLVNNPEIFVKWGRLIHYRRQEYKKFIKELENDNWNSLFIALIESLPILKKVRYKEPCFIFDDFKDTKIPVFPFLHFSDQIANPLYLFSFENINAKPVIVFEDPYSIGYSERYKLDDNEIAKERYQTLRQILGFQNVREGIIYLFGGGYEHITNLSLAIADVDPGSPRETALKEIIKKYRDRFPDIDIADPKDFITLLIADLGPTKILGDIFNISKFLLSDYLKYFEDRGLGVAFEWKSSMTQHIEARKKHISTYLSLNEDLREEINQSIDNEAYIWCMLKAAGLDISPPGIYVESMDDRIQMLQDWRVRYQNNNTSNFIININKIAERTFKFLIVFYSGLEGYFKSVQEKENDYEHHESAMIEYSRKVNEEIKVYSIGMLVGYFRENILKKIKLNIINTLLGKNNICNISDFNDNVTNRWTSIVNREKHDYPSLSKEDVIYFYEQTEKIFNYLRYGIDDKPSMGYSLEPIYPLVISFKEVRHQRDGMFICSYKIYSIGEKEGYDINILTPRRYLPEEEYYCIPLYHRSTGKWWLEPFMIRCEKFNSIFKSDTQLT